MATIIVALDVPSTAEALDVVDRLDDTIGFYKVGSPLFTREGPTVVRELRDRGKRVFLDLKYHDIPHVIGRAVEGAAAMGVDLLTLHAAGGTSMLRAAVDARADADMALLGVTLLTSLTASDVEEVWGKELRSLREEVARLAQLAVGAGLDGVVASALEAEALKRRHGTNLLVVTPGIRPAGESPTDQVRTATPADAVRSGSDYLVIGRPILDAADPADAARQILDEVAAAEDAT